jgi:hypothetical protein
VSLNPRRRGGYLTATNPNSLMVAELAATISKPFECENHYSRKSKEEYPAGEPLNFGFPRR